MQTKALFIYFKNILCHYKMFEENAYVVMVIIIMQVARGVRTRMIKNKVKLI